ncbi:hypothetical protein [Nocardia sp. NPDC060249]|uniref:hypothetical protein n=1 Tax=Nocardia sp. NPDC060249 TaxID=3347082 RepID=UPI0036570705
MMRHRGYHWIASVPAAFPEEHNEGVRPAADVVEDHLEHILEVGYGGVLDAVPDER